MAYIQDIPVERMERVDRGDRQPSYVIDEKISGAFVRSMGNFVRDLSLLPNDEELHNIDFLKNCIKFDLDLNISFPSAEKKRSVKVIVRLLKNTFNSKTL